MYNFPRRTVDLKQLRRSIDRFCVLHPHFGIPGLMRFIVAGNVLVYLLNSFSDLNIYYSLSFNLSAVLQGEIWRIFTFPFVPNDTSAFYLLLSCYFYYWIGSTLEREWGQAKFTIYYVSGVVLTLLGAVLSYFLPGGTIYSVAGTMYVNLAMFFAFAMLYPNAQVLLFFFIPVRMKWLAALDGALFAAQILTAIHAGYWVNALSAIMALLNFFVFFMPDLEGFVKTEHKRVQQASHFHRTNAQARAEQKFQGFRHKCAVCGRTDTEHPELQFRYCSKCAGYHCYCADHIFNHVHVTDEI